MTAAQPDPYETVRQAEHRAAEKALADHALANGGCVPKPAYDELAAGIRQEAWETLTRLAKDHRHCDCTGTFPCDVRQIVDRFGQQFVTHGQPA